ncbi:unnamed protein product [Aureobasidium vineae]|uniref:Uncharacterized protein n=1 Tax=Aureobasidium vineae TaxID=2773715 RepID=A0A9N8PF91_9PEZI|nr:unnamed protein product [Aureobasidium vineae]
MYAPSTFITWRKHSRRSVEELLNDFTNLVNRGVLSIINLSVSKASFVAVVECERDWDEIEEDVLQAMR